MALHDKNTSNLPLQLNAGWEIKSPSKSICRWLVAWVQKGNTEIAGAVAGYSGGGTFQVERFFGTYVDGRLDSLWIDLNDTISGEEVSFSDLDQEVLDLCERALDTIWDWNDHDIWTESDDVVLIQSKRRELIKEYDMYLHSTENHKYLKIICEKAGLTAGPKS